MRKAHITVLFSVNFVPKGEKGDEIKQKLNQIADEAFKNEEKVVTHEMVSSKREYLSKSGNITSEFVAHISDDVNFNNGEVDPVNDSVWSFIRGKEPTGGRMNSKTWMLDDVVTNDIEHVTSTIDEEERVKVDLDDRTKYIDQDNPAPEYKNTRTLYPDEFDEAFEAIMEELRHGLKLSNKNYRMERVLVDKETANWDCEQCGSKDVELHHEIVRETVKRHFREKLSDLDGFIIDEDTGEVYMESTTITAHIAQIVHNEDVLTPLCPECHRKRH